MATAKLLSNTNLSCIPNMQNWLQEIGSGHLFKRPLNAPAVFVVCQLVYTNVQSKEHMDKPAHTAEVISEAL